MLRAGIGKQCYSETHRGIFMLRLIMQLSYSIWHT